MPTEKIVYESSLEAYTEALMQYLQKQLALKGDKNNITSEEDVRLILDSIK